MTPYEITATIVSIAAIIVGISGWASYYNSKKMATDQKVTAEIDEAVSLSEDLGKLRAELGVAVNEQDNLSKRIDELYTWKESMGDRMDFKFGTMETKIDTKIDKMKGDIIEIIELYLSPISKAIDTINASVQIISKEHTKNHVANNVSTERN